MQIKVEWDLDGLSPVEAGVPEIVTLPEDLPVNKHVSDYLSDTYGWCVFHWSPIESEECSLNRKRPSSFLSSYKKGRKS